MLFMINRTGKASSTVYGPASERKLVCMYSLSSFGVKGFPVLENVIDAVQVGRSHVWEIRLRSHAYL